ncbi:MAG: hypothetical protein EBT70_05995 [Betaproteobacteria bacterium]|nr:hypothetical protein [Betaproteobacteria bacterium]
MAEARDRKKWRLGGSWAGATGLQGLRAGMRAGAGESQDVWQIAQEPRRILGLLQWGVMGGLNRRGHTAATIRAFKSPGQTGWPEPADVCTMDNPMI